MIPATYPSILDSSNRTKMLVYQVPSITGLTRWIDYIPVKSPTSESDLTLANTFANEGFILTSKVNDITGLVPFKDYVPIYLDSTATKAWSADNDGYIPMAELAGLLLDFTTGTLDPRIAFTRATNATVTNSAGQITYAPHNLLTYSEQFDNAAWTKTTTTVTANAIASPTSTTTGDTLTAGGANSTTLHSYTAIAQPYTFSIYIRRRTGTGTIEITADGSTYVAKTITSDWTRFDTTITPTAGARTPGVRIVTSGDAIDVWGAQLEIGSTATTYNSTTVKNLLGYSELFDNAAWTKSNSFVQTNLLTYSEDFSNAAWLKDTSGGTLPVVTANQALSPNGYQTADRIVFNKTGGVFSRIQQVLSATSGITYTFSVWLKSATGSNVNLGIRLVTTASNCLVTNEWQRFTITAAANATTIDAQILLFDSIVGNDETADVYAWGAQLVQGSVAGDYRRTDAAALPVYYPNHNGVVCAEKLVEDASTNPHSVLVSVTGTTNTLSIYAKAGENRYLWLKGDTSSSDNTSATIYDLQTGTIVSTGSTLTSPAIISAGNGYYRCSGLLGGSKNRVQIGCTNSSTVLTYAGDGTSGIYIFGAQLSDSASLDPYVLNAAAAPTAAAYYGARFDYDPVTLAPKGLLIEEQRVNYCLWSEDFSQATWSKTTTTVTSNSEIAPSGLQTADTLTATGTNAITKQAITTTAVAFTFSVYLKRKTGTGNIDISMDGTTFVTQTINSSTWTRCIVTQTGVAGTSNPSIRIATNGDEVYAWGAQVE